jgi:hypothetical protein
LAFIFISKLYRQMYASTGLAADSARRNRANKWARWLAAPCRKLFQGAPMPGLQVPQRRVEAMAVSGRAAQFGSGDPSAIGCTLAGKNIRRKEHGDYSGRSFRRKYSYSESKNEA